MALVHYGNPKKYVYLMQVNGISDPDRLPSGRTLRIPTVGRYRVKKGDTLGKIAARFLRSSKRADFLTWLNRIKDPARLEPGTVITIPFLIRHRAQQGQTMVDVARRYYFTSRSTGLLRRFNGRKTNALREGEIIWVPIFDPDAFHEKVLKRRKAFEKRQKKLKEQARHIAKRAVVDRNGSGSSNAANDRDSKVKNGAEPGNKRSRAASVIERAFKLYREGEYQLALAILKEHVERQDVKPAEEARAREIMAYCLVALDRPR
ncbi:MAG: LysM peptidoglycan-binding domain-containing protein, partial [Deltaproteobacteria bacterium]